MNKDRLDASEKQFWKGKTSLEEERLLKSNLNDPYFDAVNAASKESMDLNFEDFMQKVEVEKKEAKIVEANFLLSKWWWAAAAIILVIVLFKTFYPTKTVNEIVNNKSTDVVVKSNTAKDSTKAEPTKIVHAHDQTVTTQKTATQVASNTLAIQHRKAVKPSPKATVVPETDTLGVYQPQFVLVNGKPVYSEDEAIKITKQSLTLLADNVSKGANHLSVVKELSIHL